MQLERSFESADSDEKDDPHYNFESDGEPPTDQAGDLLQVVKKR